MKTKLAAVAALAGPLVLTVATAAPVMAAATESASLQCGSAEYEVTGFGRGQVLQVVDSNDVFVVTFAQLGSGQVVFNNPGLADAGHIVTCTTTAPSGTPFIFRGFFTPRS